MKALNINFNWSEWETLEKIGKNTDIPNCSGLYRVRVKSEPHLSYIGQTGSSLRGRLGQLSNGIFKEIMPYNDPHTAGPAFWALKQKSDVELEASVCMTEDINTPNRKGLECLAIYEHRRKFGFSPSFNFGRMPIGFSKSSGNTQRLVIVGKRFRGSATSEVLNCHEPGLPPQPSKDIGGSDADQLFELNWTKWKNCLSLTSLGSSQRGIYVLKSTTQANLLYVGEGKIRDRISSHLKKGKNVKHTQYAYFNEQVNLRFAYWMNNSLKSHQRLEIENDLIGLHIKRFKTIPSAQFVG